MPKLYQPRLIWLFYGLYAYNAACFVASVVVLLTTDEPHLGKHFTITNIIGFTATTFSILTFFLARWNYYRKQVE